MHPIFQSRIRSALYFLAWISIGTVYAVELSDKRALPIGVSAMFTIPHALLLGFIASSAWYWCRTFPLRTMPLLRVAAAQAAAALLSLGVWTLAGMLYFEFLFPDREFPLLDVFAGGKIFLFVTILLFYLVIEFDRARDMEKRAIDLQLQNREAQLRALRMQINPHFLFNSLNSVSALTSRDPQAARHMTILLADFFRNSLKSGEQESIPLRQEIDLARQYLEIEKIRFGNRLDVRWKDDPDAGAVPVPPLILQPLVENAIKHGIAPLADGGTVTITTEKNAASLRVTVDNPVDPAESRPNGNQMGLQNVKNRLRTVYGDRAWVDVHTQRDFYSVVLHLPAETPYE
jgi:hypothetical protein